MDSRYTHDMTDATAVALFDYANNIVTLATMRTGATENLTLTYEKPDGETSEVIIYAMKDGADSYYLNEVHFDSLVEATHIYSLACADLLKEIACDEKQQDAIEDMCRHYVSDVPEVEEVDCRHLILENRFNVFGVCEAESVEEEEDEEIVEVYPASNSNNFNPAAVA